MLRKYAKRSPRRAFTVLEVMLVSGLMSLLVLLISGAWAGLVRPSADVIARCRVAQEANLAMECLARDLGGALADQPAGTARRGRLVGRLVVGNASLWLCFDGEPVDDVADWAAPDTVITYDVQANQLVRSNLQTGETFAAAANVTQMQLTEQVDGVRIDLSFQYRDITRDHSFIAKDP